MPTGNVLCETGNPAYAECVTPGPDARRTGEHHEWSVGAAIAWPHRDVSPARIDRWMTFAVGGWTRFPSRRHIQQLVSRSRPRRLGRISPRLVAPRQSRLALRTFPAPRALPARRCQLARRILVFSLENRAQPRRNKARASSMTRAACVQCSPPRLCSHIRPMRCARRSRWHVRRA